MFKWRHYLLIRDCKMGTVCAPSYANIFLTRFENKNIYPLINNKEGLYLRYCDYLICKVTEEELKNFFNKIINYIQLNLIKNIQNKNRIPRRFSLQQWATEPTNNLRRKQEILSSCKILPFRVTQKEYSV